MIINKKLNQKDIIDKEFSVDYKGYNAKEVDLFLDLIGTDYEIMEDLLTNYAKQNHLLESNNQKLLHEIERLKLELLTLKQQKQKLEAKGVENVDIITRLSKLESIVHDD